MLNTEKPAGYPLKRPIDLLLSVSALIVLSPLLAVVALLVRVRHGAPILYVQERPGLHGKPFKIYKFRSMTNARNATGTLLPDEQRLTRFGSFIRGCSIDELPELYNVVRGEMSLVGPRPLLVEYLPLYTPYQRRRHEAKPGLTGWAQINGRNSLKWEEKFAYDVWYVDNRSLLLDLKILVKTVSRIFQRRGISADGHATMPLFRDARLPENPSNVKSLRRNRDRAHP